MPPKQITNIDGVSRSPLPLSPAVNREPGKDVTLNHAASESTKSGSPKKTIKNDVKTSKVDHGPAVVIILTVAVMIFLIALAYYAYHKSK